MDATLIQDSFQIAIILCGIFTAVLVGRVAFD